MDTASEGGVVIGLNLDRLRVATDKLIDAVCVGEPWQVSGAQAAPLCGATQTPPREV